MLCGGRYDDVLIMYVIVVAPSIYFFFFNDTATTEIYTLSLHDALPICVDGVLEFENFAFDVDGDFFGEVPICHSGGDRSEEHTSELQSLTNIVCRLLLEKKKKIIAKYLIMKHNSTHHSTDLALVSRG